MVRIGTAVAAAGAVGAVGLAVLAPDAPDAPDARPATEQPGVTAVITSRDASDAVVLVHRDGGPDQRVQVTATGGGARAGLAVERYRGTSTAPADTNRPTVLSIARGGAAQLGPAADRPPVRGGRDRGQLSGLDVGGCVAGHDHRPGHRPRRDPAADRSGPDPGRPRCHMPAAVATSRSAFTAQAVAGAAAAARADHDVAGRRSVLFGCAVAGAFAAAVGLLCAGLGGWLGRRRPAVPIGLDRVPEGIFS